MSKRDWYVDHFGGDDNTRVVRNRADKDQIVAGPVDYRHYESCTIVEGIDESDATLIAAAPDLLAALEDESHVSTAWMLDWVADRMVKVYGESENVDFVQSIRKRASFCRAALKKAKGTP